MKSKRGFAKDDSISDIIYFCGFMLVNILKINIHFRFKSLFERRKKWNYDEIKAYLQDICSNDITEINNALTKFTKPFTQNNVKYFTNRF